MSVVAEPASDERRGEKGPVDLRPYLCIPYWTSPLTPGGDPDTGEERPLPGNVISWYCAGIHTSPYKPGERLDVQVEVCNGGAGSGSALATVVAYWVDATAGFPKKLEVLDVASVAVEPRGGRAVTKKLTGVIPASASNHICLLCRVSHSLDKAGNVADPLNDRHWAQRNLTAVGAAPGAPAALPFDAANPFPEHEELFRLDVRMLELDLLDMLAAQLGGSPADTGVRIRLMDEDGKTIGEDIRAGTELQLDPGDRRRFHVEVEPFAELEGDRLTAVEAVLFARNAERTVGSLGIVLRSPDADPLRERRLPPG